MHELDTLTERDFFRLFKRVSCYVNLKGCRSAEDIMLKIRASKACQRSVERYSERRKKWVSERGSMETLLDHGFDKRVIEEAAEDRHSLYNLTLLFGPEKAVEIKKKVGRKKARRWWMKR